MVKLILISVLLAMVAIPVWASRDRRPGRALKNTLLLTVGVNVLYILALSYVVSRYPPS